MARLLVKGKYLLNPAKPGGETQVLEEAAVAVEGSTIAAVGDYSRLKKQYPDHREIGSNGHLIIPGLVNVHHHGWGLSSVQQGKLDDVLEPWIYDLLGLKSPTQVYLDTLYGNLKLLESGVTTVLHSHYCRTGNYEEEVNATLKAYETSGQRVALALEVLNQHPFAYNDDWFMQHLPADLRRRVEAFLASRPALTRDQYLNLVERFYKERHEEGPARVKILYGPINSVWTTPDILEAIGEQVQKGRGLHIHVVETPYQAHYFFKNYGKSNVAWMHELHLLSPRTSFAHAVWTTRSDLELMADTAVTVCHNASSNLRLRSGIAPVAFMQKQGVNVGIGTDGDGINDDDDMIQEMRLVSKLHRLPRLTSPWVNSHDVIRMATIGGARAVLREEYLGKLEPGRAADIVLVNLHTMTYPYLSPQLHRADAFIYRAKGTDVDTVIIDGEVVMEDRKHLRFNKDEVLEQLREAALQPPTAKDQERAQLYRQCRPVCVEFLNQYLDQEFAPQYLLNRVS
jgi:cytosine/adenosine deaminase-related metal-dependent hydrolase